MVILLDNTNCRSETGLEIDELLELTGIFGIHNARAFNALIIRSQVSAQLTKEGNIVTVKIKTPLVKALEVDIYFKLKIIHIELFQAVNPADQIGFPRLIAQIDAAKKNGYTRITLLAYGNKTLLNNWTGYIVWGKYGFLMVTPKHIQQFEKLIEGTPFAGCRYIGDLVSTEPGTIFWRDNGWTWAGEFILDPASESMRIYNGYRQKKGL
jgi:hypothetical protein